MPMLQIVSAITMDVKHTEIASVIILCFLNEAKYLYDHHRMTHFSPLTSTKLKRTILRQTHT